MMTRTRGWISRHQHAKSPDEQIEDFHAAGHRCDGCGAAGGCVALAAAVRRRTAPPPWGSRVVAILLNGALPTR